MLLYYSFVYQLLGTISLEVDTLSFFLYRIINT